MTDVAYIVGPEQRDWLRWSLRSLANLPHDRVWLVGAKPDWCQGVLHVQTKQRDTKYKNSTNNVRVACQISALSDDFVLMNDDFFIMEPIDDVPVLHRGTVEAFMTEIAGDSAKGFWQTVFTFRQLGYNVTHSYELHVPMKVNKELMLRAITLGQHVPILHKRTAYAAVAQLHGEGVADCKVRGNDSVPDHLPFISTGRNAVRPGTRTYKRLNSLFPEPSRYEAH